MPRLAKLSSSLRLTLRIIAPSLAFTFAFASPAMADDDAPQNADDGSRAAAKAAVQRGQAAFQAGDYASAITAFDEANRLRPAPKLDYNLGICHQQLHTSALSEGDHDADRLHANAAIGAYNRYLAARPTADDRHAVEELVRGLGGTPVTSAALKPAQASPHEGSPPADEPASDPPPEGESSPQLDDSSDMSNRTDPEGEREPSPRSELAILRLPRGSFVAGLALWSIPQMNAHSTVEGASMGGLTLRAGAHLGARRWLFVGGGVAVAGGGNNHTKTKLASAAQAFDALIGLHIPLGSADRLVLPLTGIIGAGRETLRTRSNLAHPTCSVGSGTLVAARWGGRVGARAGVLILLGARRNHGLSIDLDALANLYGSGPVADGCTQSVFQESAVPRVRASIELGFGYGLRF